MSGKTLLAVVLTLVSAAYGFGQQTETAKEQTEKPCTETQTLTAQIAEAKKRREIDFSENNFGRRALLKNFLPTETGAWVIEIVTTGGFTGKGLPTLTITSNGDLFIASDNFSSGNQNNPTKSRKLETEILQKISQIVRAESLTETVKKTAGKNEPGQEDLSLYCSDCYQTSIIVVRRDANGEIRYFSNRQKLIIFSSGDFNRIHQIVMEQAGYLK